MLRKFSTIASFSNSSKSDPLAKAWTEAPNFRGGSDRLLAFKDYEKELKTLIRNLLTKRIKKVDTNDRKIPPLLIKSDSYFDKRHNRRADKLYACYGQSFLAKSAGGGLPAGFLRLFNAFSGDSAQDISCNAGFYRSSLCNWVSMT